MLFTDHLCSRILTSATLCGLIAQKRVQTNSRNLQNRAARIITKAHYSTRSCDILEELNWPTLYDRQKMPMNIMIYKVYHDDVPEYLTELFCFV